MLAPLLLLLAAPAHAIQCLTPLLAEQRRLFGPMPTRPTEGGMFSFEDEDVVEHLDSADGAVRVHYSVSGPNVTLLDDDDTDGLPDYAELVAETTAGVFDFYEDLGFRRPLGEEAMGLGEIGGSYAFDVYLVDFAGQGDGAFSADACDSDPNVCSGFFMIENDLSGYGYGSIEAGVDTLCSHELFHAVQAAYEAESPIWYTEGTAVLAEKLWRPDSADFLAYADAYLDDPERSLDNPPTGPVPLFAYATALWWDFMNTRLGTDALVQLQAALEWDGAERDTLAEMEQVIAAHGSDLGQEWTTFAGWNLATRFRAGAMESYDYASEIGPITITDVGAAFEDDKRFYPLAASYYQLQHPGGELWFANDDDATGVVFYLFPVDDGTEAGRIEPATMTWSPTEPARFLVAEDLPAGIWWVVGTHARIAENSQHFTLCLGDSAQAEVCVPPTGDTGSPDDTGDDEPGGCGCAGGARPAGLLGLVLTGLSLGRRRRAR
ncbi:MAG: MXAN_6640 family putative metalloprotease [Pseudomonadota bacterium]